MRAYSQEIQDYIRLHVQGTTTENLVLMVNAKFNAGFTKAKMKSYKTNHKLRSGTPCGLPAERATMLYPAGIKKFIAKNHVGIGPKNMAELLNHTFGTHYTAKQMKSYYANHKINSETTGYFLKGHTPANKGQKGYYAPGCEKGWFQKGQVPVNHKQVGSERIDKDGYTLVKTAEPNVWRLKHRMIWEAAHGKVPAGYVVTFLDGDKHNFDPGNLALISQAENVVMETSSLRSENPEFTKTGILIAKVTLAGSQRKKRIKRGNINEHHD